MKYMDLEGTDPFFFLTLCCGKFSVAAKVCRLHRGGEEHHAPDANICVLVETVHTLSYRYLSLLVAGIAASLS